MKYFTLFLVGALCVPSLSFAQMHIVEGGAMFSFDPDRGTYSENHNFSVTLFLEAPERVTSVEASVFYDASRLEVLNVEKYENLFPYWWKTDVLNNADGGKIMLRVSAQTPGIQGAKIPLATFNFRTTHKGLASLLLDEGSLALDASDKNILNTSYPAGAVFMVGEVSFNQVGSFARNAQQGDSGFDVRTLQQFLNARGFLVAPSGAGSPGQETEYFGSLTALALSRFQEANASSILAPLGLQKGTGILGASTRAYINSVR